MTWENLPHRCFKPIIAFVPVGSIWRCDEPGCTKRWQWNGSKGWKELRRGY